MISKTIGGSIINTSLQKIRLHRGEYKRTDAGGLIRNDWPTIIYLIFKSTNPATMIVVSNVKDETDKETRAKFGKNVKDLIDAMSLNY